MGQSTNAEISFGIAFEEDYEFPWNGFDIEDWWREWCGFINSFEIYDEEGNHIDGKEPSAELVELYFAEQREFDKRHPLPVELVNYCSGDYPMWIIAVTEAGRLARRGYPVAFNPAELVVRDAQIAALVDFCKFYDLVGEGPPSWYLSSYWG
jgi:hypothetical protein